MTAWILMFWVGGLVGGFVTVPGIATEQDCVEAFNAMQKANPRDIPARNYSCIEYRAAR